MRQTRAGSLAESLINVAIGLGISMAANALVFPFFGWHISAGQNLRLALIFTVISILRSWVIRLWFNAWIHRKLSTEDLT